LRTADDADDVTVTQTVEKTWQLNGGSGSKLKPEWKTVVFREGECRGDDGKGSGKDAG